MISIGRSPWRPWERFCAPRAIQPFTGEVAPEEIERLRLAFSQGERVPAFAKRHSYGGHGTIHQTGTIDIQVDKLTGEVHAVWFRCLNLPFTVSEVRDDLPLNPRGIAIEEITYAELPSEESTQ